MNIIFLDRDNTLNHDPGYINDPDNFKLKDNVIEGLKLLQHANFHFIVITNQSGISRGLITKKQLDSVHKKLETLLSEHNIYLTAIYYCPDKNDDSPNRKPNPGMINQALEDFPDINIYNSYIIGDRMKDILTGTSFHLSGILLQDNSAPIHPEDKEITEEDYPDNLENISTNLLEASYWILQNEAEKKWKHKIFYKDNSEHNYLTQIEALRSLKLKIIFTNGCFDITHAGHYQYLGQAAQLGDIFIVGLNSDNSVKKLKGETRPIFSEEERAMKLAQLAYVDMVIIFNEDTPIQLLQEIRPDIHVKGGDYQKEKMPEYDFLNSINSEIIILPFKDGYSTTKIIEKIKQPL